MLCILALLPPLKQILILPVQERIFSCWSSFSWNFSSNVGHREEKAVYDCKEADDIWPIKSSTYDVLIPPSHPRSIESKKETRHQSSQIKRCHRIQERDTFNKSSPETPRIHYTTTLNKSITVSQKRSSSALPTTAAASNGGAPGRAAALLPRGRQINKTFNNIKITILCGFVTILVLRGTIGIGNLVSYEAEAENQNLLEETNRILEEIRSDKDPEDQAEEFFNPNMTFTLGPKINNWDGDRKVWLEKNPMFPNYVNGKPRILLVTGSPPNPCDNAIGDHYLLKAAKNKIDYCRIHGIEIVYNMAHLDKEMAGYWAKLPLIRGLILAHPEVEWVWWMDSDALFTDMAFEIPVFKYKDYNMVIHGYPDLLFDQKSWIALNTGSFLFRNCQWSLDLLDAWAPMGPKGPVREEAGKILTANLKGRPAFEADDQSALIYLLISQKDQWMNKVFIENSYYLHGYWEGLVNPDLN